MATRTHYDVLGVGPGASPDTIRSAYRRLAREHHPDRGGVVPNGSAAGRRDDMATINEAYHVLRDAGRRALYDRSLRAGPAAAAAGERSAGREWADAAKGDTTPQVQFPTGPARVPWRSLLVAGTVAVVGIVVLAQFTDPGPDPPPDNILRNGDCVEFLDNGDAREVRCTGVDDNVVRAFVAFDATCPGFTEAHRDRQGMGVACVEVPTP